MQILMHRKISRVKQWSALVWLSASVFGLSMLGCHNLIGSQDLPSGTPDPSYYNNAAGALGMRNAAVYVFGTELPDYIVTTGLLADELTNVSTLTNSIGGSLSNGGAVRDPLDERKLPELSYGSAGSYRSDAAYNNLQGTRVALLQAIGQLGAYDSTGKDTAALKPAAGRALRGELYALYGYTEIMLADLFCSGVPLSTLNFQHDFTYNPGSSWDAVYKDAISKFDTALVLAADSARILNLARVGQGRAYLDLGKYTAAADDVSNVPRDFEYHLLELFVQPQTTYNRISQDATTSDREGGVGLPYLTDGDPRTADTVIDYWDESVKIRAGFPRVYNASFHAATGEAPVTIASWIEARLIQAESALQSGNIPGWLALLNQLRQTAPIPGTTTADPSRLPDLTDPGAGLTGAAMDSARFALMFRERATWLYMTGHRQGDLRRQLRQYSRYWNNQSKLYPTGVYLGIGSGTYGTDVNAPIPANEYLNPQFHGCLNRAP